MPVSKRAKIVHESKVTKKSHKEQTRRLYANVQEAVSNYDHLFVFSVDNMRNTYLKDVRTEFSEDGRLFFGKTKVMAVALGTNPETAFAPNLDKLSPYLNGAVGLLFTSRSPKSVLDYFSSFHPMDFARAGNVSPRAFTIPSGIVYAHAGEIPEEHDQPISHTIEPTLRKLGVPTRLVRGKVTLDMEGGYQVCKAGETLDSRQTTLLKMFGVAVAEFRVEMRAHWTKETGEVEVLQKDEGMEVDH
ncbi:mRNA turnover protein MRT4 [Coccidioides immitis RS]|uniref:Ribosome assembly factor mrt4 n=7 Tax=Coccidioides TaxID=5500 RepID=J3K264_COCIM|nr:mRNA turnover protein MRT4 [Coccidioides immitis RS]XP_003067282.1 mRNA turnover protein MRT4 [Coccidioides posadasii C735 delta SOWgp]EFW19525.1 60S acidic ribosomal protein P0 [Coccidioides posadasii str. Silveira]KMM71984.1 mRNA turnover protein 4 [Coccidioides posadasii RMSCC 3488]KMP08978.1 mRNA turnover protein 4 [Coccidioides immitis RMSCC 2394]KMU74132.1 mRNA turnover protein 4 [Coccidioides immitis RMSCC 3703]KMU89213.1 mRNA turnover protein 4 [Coccidioides immitis H538.4]TPX2081|eukprot:XP_003067282.1 mRNA turnover protein MRT4 [Coccidioides posadasii C735 delta SOWgp]